MTLRNHYPNDGLSVENNRIEAFHITPRLEDDVPVHYIWMVAGFYGHIGQGNSATLLRMRLIRRGTTHCAMRFCWWPEARRLVRGLRSVLRQARKRRAFEFGICVQCVGKYHSTDQAPRETQLEVTMRTRSPCFGI